MYFILSKILLFIILPLNWILLVLVFALLTGNKVKKRALVVVGLVLLCVFTNPLLFKGFTRLWDIKPQAHSNNAKYSSVIVLGGFSGPDGHGGGRFSWAADRFINGAQLLTTGVAKRILISSGNASLTPGYYREADWARLQLLELGIADSLILTESNSRNTIENAQFSKNILDSNKLKPPYLLVTSAFHMRRAAMIFNKKGIDVIPYPCTYLVDNSSFQLTDLLPRADVLSHWGVYLKEVVGYVVNYYSVN